MNDVSNRVRKSPLVLLSIFILSMIILTGCSSSGAENRENSINIIALVMAIVLVAAGAYAIYWLISSGKYKTWTTAGINSSKWKLQDSKLSSELKKLGEEKTRLVNDLGVKAWEERVKHPAYGEPFTQLEVLEKQVDLLDEDIKATETNLKQVKDTYDRVTSEYEKQLSNLHSEQKDSDSGLKKIQSRQSDLEKQFSKLGQEKSKAETGIQEFESKLEAVQASDEPDKDKQAASITSKIADLEKTLLNAASRLPELETQISGVKSEQNPVLEKLSRLAEQIERVQTERNATLNPLEQQLEDLGNQLKLKKEAMEDLHQKMTPIIASLGPIVNANRPESGVLAGAYYDIDKNLAEITAKTQEQVKLQSLLEACDKNAIRNFFIMIGAAIVWLILVVVLLVIAF